MTAGSATRAGTRLTFAIRHAARPSRGRGETPEDWPRCRGCSTRATGATGTRPEPSGCSSTTPSRRSASAALEAEVDPRNLASQRVATRSGLRREGVRRVEPGMADRARHRARLRPAGDRPTGQRAGGLPRAAQLLPAPQAGDQPDADARPRRPGAAVPAHLQAGLGPARWRRRGRRVAPARRSAARSRRSSASTIAPGRLLLTDWLPPWGGWDDALCLVFDGGVHDAAIARARRARRSARSATRSSPRSTRCASAAPTSPPAGSPALANLAGARRRTSRAAGTADVDAGPHRRSSFRTTAWQCPRRREYRPMTYVHDFAEGNKDQKDLLGGKGANLAEMTSLGPAGPAGLHDHHRGLPRLPRSSGDLPDGWPTRSTTHLAALEDAMGRRLGDPDDPLLVVGALRRQVLDARDDGDRPRHRPQRRSPSRAWPARAATSGSRWTPTAGCCRCSARPCSTSTPSVSPTPSTRPRQARASPTDLDLDADDLRALVDDLQGASSRSTPAAASRRTRASSCDLAVRAVFDSWNTDRARPLPPPGADPRATSAPRSTCRPWSSATAARTPGSGVAFTRDPATGAPGRLRRLPAERPGRGRRRRHPQHRLASPTSAEIDPKSLRRAARDHGHASRATTATCATSSSPSSAASCGCCRPGSASAPRRPRSGSPSHMVDEGLIDLDEALLRVTGDQLAQLMFPRFDDEGRAHADRQGHERLPRRGRRQGGLRLRHRGRVGRAAART